MAFVLFAVSVLTFLIFNVIPNGYPAARMAGKHATDGPGRSDQRGVGVRRASSYEQYATTMRKLVYR